MISSRAFCQESFVKNSDEYHIKLPKYSMVFVFADTSKVS